jgi:uncharacterized BrkB/YihY/UPF0761 family membrane protein
VTVVVVVAGVAMLAALDALRVTTGSVAGGAFALLTRPPFLLVYGTVVVILGYRTLPPRPPRWHALMVPALIVGVTLVALSQAFTFLVPRLVGVAHLAGSLASAFVALAWLSLSFQAFLLGAAWVLVRDAGPQGAIRASLPRVRSALGRAAAPAEPGGRRE